MTLLCSQCSFKMVFDTTAKTIQEAKILKIQKLHSVLHNSTENTPFFWQFCWLPSASWCYVLFWDASFYVMAWPIIIILLSTSKRLLENHYNTTERCHQCSLAILLESIIPYSKMWEKETRLLFRLLGAFHFSAASKHLHMTRHPIKYVIVWGESWER